MIRGERDGLCPFCRTELSNLPGTFDCGTIIVGGFTMRSDKCEQREERLQSALYNAAKRATQNAPDSAP